MTTTIRRFAAHEWRMYRELRLRALKDSPDSFGSTYEREAARTDHHWETRLVIAWSKERGVRELRLDVTAGHPAALRLYRRAGFVDAGEPEPVRPGSPTLCQPMRLLLEPSIRDWPAWGKRAN